MIVPVINRQQLVALLTFIFITVVGIALLSALVDRDVLHSGISWRPFDVHPLAFGTGLIVCIAGLLAIIRMVYDRQLKAMPLAVLAALSLLGVGLCAAATVPGAGSVAIRDVISPADPAEQPVPFGFAVLFANKLDRLDTGDAATLKRQMEIFHECATSKITLRGFASSASFRIASDDHNFALANRRAMAVARFLKSLGYDADVHIWNNYDEMRNARRAVDVGNGGQRLLGDEARNRRVEVLWHGSPCSGL